MLLAAVVVGGLAAYYFGLRVGAWVAAATIVLCVVALWAPRLATPLYALLAAGAIAIWRVGSRRPRRPDAVVAVQVVRRGIARVWSAVRGSRDDR